MKQIKLFTCIFAILFIFTACEENAIDPLTGIYDVPTEYSIPNLFGQNMQKQENGTRIFSLKMASEGPTATYDETTFSYNFSGSGNYISIDFVGKDYFLEEGTYAIASNESAQAGTYIAGYDAEFGGISFENWGTCFFTVADGTTSGLKVTSGNVSVSKDGDNYSISGALTLADNSVVRVGFSGVIIYEPDAYVPTYTYSVEKETPAIGGADGTVAITGTTKHKITVYADDVFTTYLEVITDENATSLSGTYSIKDGIDAVGQIANGFYLDFAWFGGEGVLEGGSYYIEDDEKMFIREGDITIEDNGGTLSINGDNLGILDLETLIESNGATWTTLATSGRFLFADVVLDGTSGGQEISLNNLIAASALDLSAYGGTGYNITLKIATDGIGATYDAITSSYVYSGTGNYISLDFNRDDATLPAGTYNVVSNESAAVGDCVAGYPNPYGEGTWGSVWGSSTDGLASDIAVTGGTVEVSVNGDNYTVTVDVTTDEGNVKASYTGAISIQ